MHLSTNVKKLRMLPFPTARFYFSKVVNKAKCRKNKSKFVALNWQEYQRYRTKILDKLRKEYAGFIRQEKESLQKQNAELPHKKSNIIWLYWAQGFENAPDIIKMCAQSIMDHFSNTGGGYIVSFY